MTMIPLGLKLNNPSNIRWNPANHWQGQIGHKKGFCEFKTMAFGLRALLCLIRTYRYVYGLDTIEKIITRFAPPNENDTQTYINNVSSALGFSSDYPLHFDFYSSSPISTLYYLASAIVKQETGYRLTHDTFLDVLKLI